MGYKQRYKENVDPPLPAHISKENVGIWIGWTYKGDKELIREAATKGHIPLAIQFLTLRSNISTERATEGIKNEVLTWVDELLERQLIFRISTLLSNIGLNPIQELQSIFCKTTNADQRAYIGNHLRAQNALPSQYEQLWAFLDIIVQNKVLTHDKSLQQDSIEQLEKKSDGWKEYVAAKLFMATHDQRLVPFLRPDALWRRLVESNEVPILKEWIQIAYSSETDTDIPSEIRAVLKTFNITDSMIEDLTNLDCHQTTLEALLNQFGKYGIFIKREKNFLTILSRINKCDTLVNVFQILEQKSSNLRLLDFLSLLIRYCSEQGFINVLNTCTSRYDISQIPHLEESTDLAIMLNFRKLALHYNPENMRSNVLKVSEYLGKGNLEQYFSNNPLIFFWILLLTPEISIEQSMIEKSLDLGHTDYYNCFSSILKTFPLLSNIFFHKSDGRVCNITYLDLVDKHLGIDSKSVFAFHFERSACPSFDSPPEPKEGFAYSKKIDYTFYVRQCRPITAGRKFFIDVLKAYSVIDDKARNMATEKVYRIALKNFQNYSLVSSCVTFLNVIDSDSKLLRISLEAANILCASGMTPETVATLFLNADKDPYAIQGCLDEVLLEDYVNFTELLSSGSAFIKLVKIYDVVVEFSRLHQLALPETLLRKLAQNDLWFPFLLYAQLKNYPIDQIKELCCHFRNPSLLEHVVHSVLYDIQVDETKVLVRERDSRGYMSSKSHVRRKDATIKCSGLLKSGSLESNNSSSGSEFLEIDISNTKATLLQILIRCHNSTDPPKALLQASQLYRNPVLAILATSYEPDSVVANWLTWLAVSTESFILFTNFESIATSSQQVANLLNKCMENQHHKALLESCIIFVPGNPLTPFCDFISDLILKEYDISFLTRKLENFKLMKSARRSSVLRENDYEMSYLNNETWIEATTLQLLGSAIIFNADSSFHQLEMVRLLYNLNIQSFFSCMVPNFDCLLEILEVLFDTKVTLDLLEYFDPSKEKGAVENCIRDLLTNNLFAESLRVARYAHIPVDVIILKKWEYNIKRKEGTFAELLQKSDIDFERENVNPDYVTAFYKERASVNSQEAYQLLKYAHKWACKFELPNRYHLERLKILALIRSGQEINDIAELDDLDANKKFITYKEMLDILDTVETSATLPSENYVERLNNIQIKALDACNFWLALKLEKMFGCKNGDLDILKLCHELAEGLMVPNQLNDEQQQVISRVKEMQKLNRRKINLVKNSSTSSERSYLESTEGDDKTSSSKATQDLIHCLIEKLTHGSDLAYTIFMKYRISVNIEVPYEFVISHTEPLKMLRDALLDGCTNKLEVVRDFFEVYHWTHEEVTDFIYDQFLNAASAYSKSKIDVFSMWDIDLTEQFHLILKLIKCECATLGYKLYNYASAIHQQQVSADLDFKISEMLLVVELLIAAHSCFTADCNMEGISTVIKKCRKVISHLLTVLSWKLIVRLLTGVGRYTELNFVFDILKENNQFEFLLSKSSKRDERLKTACIEYLKKYCPQNRDLYELVAIHFNLYSEIALVCEREAEGYLKQLLAIAEAEIQVRSMKFEPVEHIVLTKSEGTRMLLHQAMDKYVQAVEFHTQGDKLANAMNAIKQAELIAVQKCLFKSVLNNETVPCLLKLNEQTITKVASSVLDFQQSHIVAQAYNFNPDWSQILYEQAIVLDNIAYFDQFVETIGITDETVQAIVRKFLDHKVATIAEFRNIKHIVKHVESVLIKYRLASELGFNGLVQDIIDSGEIAYLKDTVWKRGYKSEDSNQ